jgi:hypothetical protein
MQPDLFTRSARFDGSTLDQEQDGPRLHRQLNKVKAYMLAVGDWRTLYEIATYIGEPEASVSARLRDLRKEKFGSYTVERRRRSVGLHEYRVTL